jgi:hypothetical protein
MKPIDYVLFVYLKGQRWHAEVQDGDGYAVFTAVPPVVGEVIAAGAVALQDWVNKEPDDCLTHQQCGACNGSGEGMHEGTRCIHCGGIGELPG